MAATRNPYFWSPTTTLLDGAYITGPYIDADRATNFPTNDYLTGLRAPKFRNLEIPQTLLDRGRANDNIDHPDPAEEWRVYLCSAIVRHFSYKKFTGPLSMGRATPSYRRTDRDFMQTFMDALPSARSHSNAQKQSLVQLEHQLTHETFGCFPELFHKVFDSNAQLACEVSNAMVNLDVIGEDFTAPRALISQQLYRLKTEWIDLTEPIDVVSGNDNIYTTYIESQARRREIMERLIDYNALLANPTPEMLARARTRARVFDSGALPNQDDPTVADELTSDHGALPQHQDHPTVAAGSSSGHGALPQHQDFRIHEDPVVTVFGVDPIEVRGALQNLMLRPVSPDPPQGQENEPPRTRERVGRASTPQGERERERRGRDGVSMFSRGFQFTREYR